ncbi:MAG TPA: rhomboid family intramembrane serine protease [Verrucomicrobiae bacterium]|jgi:GlpG protein
MRLIGHIDSDKDARTFGDFLYVQGIENEAERDANRWAIWVHSDDQIPAATKLLEEFRASPNDARFLAGSPAEKLREQAKAQDEAYQKRVVSGKKLFPGLTSYGFGFVTYGLILASVAIFLLSKMGNDYERLATLLINHIDENGSSVKWASVKHGEVWRLFTPIIIHFSIAHILFNMLWLRDLGSLFEARLSSIYLFVFVVVIAGASNAGQYFVSGRPMFGGMSGVNYALIGYVWIRGRFDPGAGLHLDRQSLIFALVWFAACFTGFLGPIANTAHGVGLVLGMAWAFVDSKRK